MSGAAGPFPNWLIEERRGWQAALPEIRDLILTALDTASTPIGADPQCARRFAAARHAFGVFLDDLHNLPIFASWEREGTHWWGELQAQPPDARFTAALVAARYVEALRPASYGERTRATVTVETHIRFSTVFIEHALLLDCDPVPADFAEFADLVDRLEPGDVGRSAVQHFVQLAERVCTPQPRAGLVESIRTTAERWHRGETEALWLPATRLRRLVGMPDPPSIDDARYPLAWAFELLNDLAGELLESRRRIVPLDTMPTGRRILELPSAARAAILRCAAAGAACSQNELPACCPPQLRRRMLLHRACWMTIVDLLGDVEPLDDSALAELLERLGADHLVWARLQGYGVYPVLLRTLERRAKQGPLPQSIRAAAKRLADELHGVSNAPERKLRGRLETLLGEPRRMPLEAGEAWADQAIRDIEHSERQAAAWSKLLNHCQLATSATPSDRWRTLANELIEAVGRATFRQRLLDWFPLVDKPRTHPLDFGGAPVELSHWASTEPNAQSLKGLAWACALAPDAELARALAALAISAYRKLPGIGPRLVKVGNACIWALGQLPSEAALPQLAMLKSRVKFGTAQKLIDKAFTAAAERLGVSRDEIEELATPSFGLTDVGLRRERVGEHSAELRVDVSSAKLCFVSAQGKLLKGAPAAMKRDHADLLKELKHAAADIQKLLPVQRERLDTLFLARRTWPCPLWRERYLNHPLVGVLARRLMWRFTCGESTADAVFFGGSMVDADGRAVDFEPERTQVELWHPLMSPADDVLAWRRWLEEHQVRQPFKQAHREIYILTDAERQTRVYSNRFAAHVLRQHQFNALCAARGWKNKLRLYVDAEFPPATRLLPEWGLRAEFWVDGIGDEYGADLNETGVFLRVATDQVRFYRIDAAEGVAHGFGGGYDRRRGAPDEPRPLSEFPPLVFSEIMRDVDLFVGVASVGNDPNWADGGPRGRHIEYWRSYAYGELAESAKTRRAVLERIIPRLSIAPRCELRDRFLVVRGDLRTYKIHIGSANILMEPNDQYLCIVPGRGAAAGIAERVYLPFEGDGMLATVLSKALMLAEDTKITDPTITLQIGGRSADRMR